MIYSHFRSEASQILCRKGQNLRCLLKRLSKTSRRQLHGQPEQDNQKLPYLPKLGAAAVNFELVTFSCLKRVNFCEVNGL